MPSLVETVRIMQAEAISAAQKKKLAAIEKDKKLSDKERFKQIDAVMNEAKMKCPECDGKGCDHCDNEGSHDMEESKGAALAKKLAKASASSEKGKKAVTLKKAPWEKKNEDNTNDKSDDGEGMDKVQPKALKKKFDDRKDKDIDNDGDEDDSDEYLHNRRKTVSKAVKEEVELDEKKKPDAVEILRKREQMKNISSSDKDKLSKIRAMLNKEKKGVKEEVEQLEELTAAEKKLINQMYDKEGNLTPMGKKVMAHGKANSKLTPGARDADNARRKEYKAYQKSMREEEELDEAPRRKRAPKMTGDSIAIQRAKDAEHNKAMGRTKTGRKKPERTMTSTQRALASLRKEEVELDEGAKEKALKALMTKALGGKQAKAGYTSAIANNGDFVVKDGGGRVVGRIEAGKFKDPLKEAEEYTDDEVEMKKAPAKKKKGKEDPKNKSGEEVDVEPTLDEAQEMTPEQEKMREKYVMKMKGRMDEFKKKYGDRAEKVMYATATKMAMKK
jgi:hypothetical protein